MPARRRSSISGSIDVGGRNSPVPPSDASKRKSTAKTSTKSNSNGKKELTNFLDKKKKKQDKLTASKVNFSDDMKSVVTFSAEDKEQRMFEQMAGRMSTSNFDLNIKPSDLMDTHDVSDDEYEEALELVTEGNESKVKRVSRLKNAPKNKNALNLFLQSPAKGKMKASGDHDDIKSVVTFTSIDRDRDQFEALSKRVSVANIGNLSDAVLMKQEERNLRGGPIAPSASPRKARSSIAIMPNARDTPMGTKKKVRRASLTGISEAPRVSVSPVPNSAPAAGATKKKAVRRGSLTGRTASPPMTSSTTTTTKKKVARKSVSPPNGSSSRNNSNTNLKKKVVKKKSGKPRQNSADAAVQRSSPRKSVAKRPVRRSSLTGATVRA